MRVKILKSFPFSRDGITPLQAVAGRDNDIPDRLVPGLQREGYVAVTTETKVETKESERGPENLFPANEPKVQEPVPQAVIPVISQDRDDVPQRDRRRRGK
jgi:hypothetical protein